MHKKFCIYFQRFRRAGLFTILLLGLASFIGCSSGNDPQAGTFVDGPITGLTYSTPTMSGTTDANGKFV